MRIVFILCTLIFFVCCTKPGQVDDNNGNANEDLGVIYFSSNNTLNSVDLNTGKYVWRTNGVTTMDFHNTIFEAGTLYSSDMYGITAVNHTDGKIKWQTYIGNRNYGQGRTKYFNSPVIIDTFIYSVTFNGASDHASLNALNKNTGQIIWKKDISDGMSRVEWRYTTPAVFDNKIVVVSCDDAGSDRMYCLDRFTGSQIWQNTANEFNYGNFPIISTDKKRIFIRTNSLRSVTSIDAENGNVQWSKLWAYITDPAEMQLWNGRLYFTSIKRYNSIDQQGEYPTEDTHEFASIEVNDGKFYSINYNSDISCHDGSEKKWVSALPSKAYIDTAKLSPGYGYFLSSLVVDSQNIFFHQRIISGVPLNYYLKNLFYIVDKQNGKVKKEIQLLEPIFGRNFVLVKENKPYYCDRGYIPMTF